MKEKKDTSALDRERRSRIESRWRGERVNVRCVWVAFVCCCFACDCVSGPVRACVLSVVEI